MTFRLLTARFFLLATGISVVASVEAQVPSYFVELGRTIESFDNAAQGGFAKADLDGDGIHDLVFMGQAGGSVLFVLGEKPDGVVGIKLSKPVADDGGFARLLAWSTEGQTRIISVGLNGRVREYVGWPLVETRTFISASGARSAAIGDVDNDGVAELLVLTGAGVSAYSMIDGLQKWSYSNAGNNDIALAQLDADPALEVILAGAVPGVVLDGATRATDWLYIDGFGARVATGRLASGGGTQWVGAAFWYQMTVFRAAPWSPLWSASTTHDIGAVATSTLDASGRDVILFGDGQWGSVHVIDSITHQERLSIPNGGYGVRALASADIDDDGTQDIAFASESAFSNYPYITVADSQSGAISWTFTPAKGPFVATALGDVDGDGSIELVAAARSGGSEGVVVVFDAITGLEKWRGPTQIGNANDPFYISVTDIALVPHTTAPGMDIVLAGRSIHDGRITVLDGVTKQPRLQIGTYSSGGAPMPAREISGIALLDYNSDGVTDYIVATQPTTTGAQGSLLHVFSGVDGATLWISPVMGSGFSRINGVLVSGAPGDPADYEMIAVMPDSLRAFNSQTGLLSWTIPVDNNGAFLVPSGMAGPEIGVYRNAGSVVIYDERNQSTLRTFSLPAPVQAVTVAGGSVDALIVATGDSIALINGRTGSIDAATEYLGAFPEFGARISIVDGGNSNWVLGSGTMSNLYRLRLIVVDNIFANSFDTL